jgi:broad specificity phosphatase PhoE
MSPSSAKAYIKLADSATLEIHKVSGFLCSRIVSYLMNLSQHKVQHPIYFVRHGQSKYNLDDRLGGNPELTAKGRLDADALCAFLADIKANEAERGVENEMQIWTSQLRRAMQTAEPAEHKLGIPCFRWSSLNEIHAGVCENMTYKEVETTYPLIHRFRSENKYSFRYPEGESYQDLVVRLEPIIMELENANRVVVVVAHQAVLRALLAYFGGTPAESAVYVEVPHRCVWRCSYDPSGNSVLDMLKLGTPTVGDGRMD